MQWHPATGHGGAAGAAGFQQPPAGQKHSKLSNDTAPVQGLRVGVGSPPVECLQQPCSYARPPKVRTNLPKGSWPALPRKAPQNTSRRTENCCAVFRSNTRELSACTPVRKTHESHPRGVRAVGSTLCACAAAAICGRGRGAPSCRNLPACTYPNLARHSSPRDVTRCPATVTRCRRQQAYYRRPPRACARRLLRPLLVLARSSS